jgi:hypothetical protein
MVYYYFVLEFILNNYARHSKNRADFLSFLKSEWKTLDFDNGALKTTSGIDAISKYYQEINANIHRGVHTLSQLATDAMKFHVVKFKIILMLNICISTLLQGQHLELTCD